MTEFASLTLERRGGVATIALHPLRRISSTGEGGPHYEIGQALLQLRDDDEVRLIVITGKEDGEFGVPSPGSLYLTSRGRRRLVDPKSAWKVFMGGIATNQLILEIEKPVIARVNGDALGYGYSVMLACDFILAREDARMADLHMSMGEVSNAAGVSLSAPFGLVPGDGGGSLAPLFMTPTRAKEIMMLSKVLTAAQMAAIGIVNRAVPMAQLDAVVDEYVQRLMRRPAHSLGWTKRVLNRSAVAQLNLTMDSSAAYEMINFLQAELASRPDAMD